MRKLILEPEQIIVPGEYELGNESILKIYYRIFEKGHGNDLPPVIVTTLGKTDEFINWLENENLGIRYWEEKIPRVVEARRRDYNTLFSILEKSPYMLIDGNHRSAAATLTHIPISTLEIQSDKDFAEIEKMIVKGNLFDFKREERSLYHLRRSFIANCLDIDVREHDGDIMIHNTTESTLKYNKAVKERVDGLVSNGDLPQYMIDKYKEKLKKE